MLVFCSHSTNFIEAFVALKILKTKEHLTKKRKKSYIHFFILEYPQPLLLENI